MGLPEEKPDRFREDQLPEDSGETNNEIWVVEVVEGVVPDTANRLSNAIDLLLAAASRPRE